MTLWIVTIFGVVAIAALVHLVLHFRRLLRPEDLPLPRPERRTFTTAYAIHMKDTTMPTKSPRSYEPAREDESRAPAQDPIQPLEAAGMSAPPMHSINDVHELRAQDQSIAQLASQYEDMSREPWSIHAMKDDEWTGGVPKTRVRALSFMLTEMMNPPVVTGSQRGISARGTLVWVNVGNQKVSAASDKAAHALHTSLMAAYLAAIETQRNRVLADLRVCAKDAATVIEWERGTEIVVVACGQTKVLMPDMESASVLRDQLNDAFAGAFHAERLRIMDELVESAKAKG